jgi:hypothetical protein
MPKPAQNLSDLVQLAAGSLPEGWTITLEVENGAGTIHLLNGAGKSIPYPVTGETIEETFEDALKFALLLTEEVSTSADVDLPGVPDDGTGAVRGPAPDSSVGPDPAGVPAPL